MGAPAGARHAGDPLHRAQPNLLLAAQLRADRHRLGARADGRDRRDLHHRHGLDRPFHGRDDLARRGALRLRLPRPRGDAPALGLAGAAAGPHSRRPGWGAERAHPRPAAHPLLHGEPCARLRRHRRGGAAHRGRHRPDRGRGLPRPAHHPLARLPDHGLRRPARPRRRLVHPDPHHARAQLLRGRRRRGSGPCLGGERGPGAGAGLRARRGLLRRRRHPGGRPHRPGRKRDGLGLHVPLHHLGGGGRRRPLGRGRRGLERARRRADRRRHQQRHGGDRPARLPPAGGARRARHRRRGAVDGPPVGPRARWIA